MSSQSLRRFYAEHQGEQISLKGCQQLCRLAYQKHSRRRSAAGMHQEGWLRKSDRKGRRWRKRWFVLAGDRLVYFKSDKPGATPINVLHLFGAKLRMVEQAQPRGPVVRSRSGVAGRGGSGGGGGGNGGRGVSAAATNGSRGHPTKQCWRQPSTKTCPPLAAWLKLRRAWISGQTVPGSKICKTNAQYVHDALLFLGPYLQPSYRATLR